ncbi:hypothetical protein FNV43_RR15908 [Rhamnella rubrinervis]|uniref:Uncharacterized protein n=1 Tax=Rhamnella rubrinervis TaxID=2594499 RepID=A0A8K0E2C7_9ROSA|nr:hypothetical protein FNV43_RR15908 [Rhamnella rubrinervis]
MLAAKRLSEHEQSKFQLLQLLKKAREERDEAVEQLQKLLSLPNYRVLPSTTQPAETLEESNTPSQFHGDQYYSSSFMSTRTTHKQRNIPQEHLKMDKTPSLGGYAAMDVAFKSAMDRLLLLKTKPLPEKGKLQQAVQAAGPLLKTLLDHHHVRTAPLPPPPPRWRNPPPVSSCLENHRAALPVLKSLKSVQSSMPHADHHGVPVAAPYSSSTMYHDFARGSGSSYYCLDGGKPIDGSMSNPAELMNYQFSTWNCES